MTDGSFTVIDVVREMGFEPTPELDWMVGRVAREMFEAIYGSKPRLELRRKTAGAGSHCFAVYPREFREQVGLIVTHITKEIEAIRLAQPELFA